MEIVLSQFKINSNMKHFCLTNIQKLVNKGIEGFRFASSAMTKLLSACQLVSLSTCLLFVACDRHDSFDDNLIIGPMAPQVYWEVGSTTADAGSNIPFTVQYYTQGEAVPDYLEVWYDIEENIEKSVSSPWITSFTYSISSSLSEEKRMPEKVSVYRHDESYMDSTLRAYTFEAAFPTSVTLSKISWANPSRFTGEDSARVNLYFGDAFMRHFKDSLLTLMNMVDFERMFQGLALVESFRTEFKAHIDSTFNDNTQTWTFHFKEENPAKPGAYLVPEPVAEIYREIPFADLIQNTSAGNYSISYARSYALNAYIRALDKNGNAGSSSKTKIALN
jgi:hypothetical protein